jgi:transcriptional antiterminator RfaH
MDWCVVHVHVGRELATADRLQRDLNLNVYVPEVVQCRRGKMQMRPLFPGYLFVGADSRTGALGNVDVTPGCGRLVRSGSQGIRGAEPVYVAEEVLRQLQHNVAHLNGAGGLPGHNLHPGDSVQITAGPMRGLGAVFLGPLTPSARVQILLHFLGCEQRVLIGLDSIEASPKSPASSTRVRRTRGHGRRIHLR